MPCSQTGYAGFWGVLLKDFIAARLRELRESHGLTQEQIAALLGTDVKWYQRIEWAKKDVRASTVDRLAEVFGLEAAEFFAEVLPETKLKRSAPLAPHRAKAKKPKGTGKKRES